MVVVEYVDMYGRPIHFYIDGMLNNSYTRFIEPSIRGKDDDIVFIVDGQERAGKSVFAMQQAKKLDKTFTLDRVCMTPQEFKDAVERAEKYQAIIYDEAFTGLSSRRALTEVNHLLVSLMMEMGQKNLIVFIVLPTFFMLDKYVALFRARGLFHIYRKGTKKGFWAYYNSDRKKKLYLKGQKLMSYSGAKPNLRGRFYNQYVIDEGKYRIKKRKALESKTLDRKETRYIDQRNRFIYMVWREWIKSKRDMEDLCEIYGIGLKAKQISTIIQTLYEEVEPYSVKKKKEKLERIRRKAEIQKKLRKHQKKMKEKLKTDLEELGEESDEV